MDLRDKVQKAICVYMDTHAAHAQSLYVQMNLDEHGLIAKAFDEAASGLCEAAVTKAVICGVWDKSVERRASEASLGPSAEEAVAPPETPVETSEVKEIEQPEIAPE